MELDGRLIAEQVFELACSEFDKRKIMRVYIRKAKLCPNDEFWLRHHSMLCDYCLTTFAFEFDVLASVAGFLLRRSG
jgi:hypothetical protein